MLLLFIPLTLALSIRPVLEKYYVEAGPVRRRSSRQFRMDFLLYSLAGLVAALSSVLFFNFPFWASGTKIIVGLTAIGLFAGIDLALERERREITARQDHTALYEPPQQLFPVTRRFSLVAVCIVALFTIVMLLVIYNNLVWLSRAQGAEAVLQGVLRDVAVVMGVLLLLSINLVFSYSKNLRLLFSNQTGILEAVSQGNLDDYVPVMTEDEFGVIAGHTNAMIAGLRDRLRLLQGVEVAREIQQNLLPDKAPDTKDFDIAAASLYCDETGGDYYDFIITPDKHALTVLIGDVTGHGLEAALLMASVRAFTRQRIRLPGSPEQCMADVNNMVVADTFGTGRFVTLFQLTVKPESQTILYTSAGHDPALVYTPGSNTFEELLCQGLPLGTVADAVYSVAASAMPEKDTILLLGPDGIWEAANHAGEIFGKEKMKECIQTHAHKSAQEILDALISQVRQHQDGQVQEDDITCIIMKKI